MTSVADVLRQGVEAGTVGLGDLMGAALRDEITPAEARELSDLRLDWLAAQQAASTQSGGA